MAWSVQPIRHYHNTLQALSYPMLRDIRYAGSTFPGFNNPDTKFIKCLYINYPAQWLY